MINSIIEGISISLNNAFNYKIYTENIEQGFKEPCFFIQSVSTLEKKQLMGRYQKTNLFDILYFPKGKNSNAECLEVAENLYSLLEYIEDSNNNLLHGTSMNYKIADGILHFFVNYNFPIYRPKDKLPNMEILNYKEKVKKKV